MLDRKTLLGFFLISFSMILLELLYVRIISVIFWHQLSYFSITLSLLGLGIGAGFYGLFVAKKSDNPHLLFFLAVLYSLAITLSIFLLSFTSFKTFEISVFNVCMHLVTQTFWLTIPFIFGGMILTAFFHKYGALSHKLYFVNLIGSGLGCLLFVVLANVISATSLCLLMAFFAAIAALLLYVELNGTFKFALISYLVVLIILSVFSEHLIKINPASGKYWSVLFEKPDFKHEYSKWGSLNRIDVFWKEGESIKVVLQDGTAPTTLLNAQAEDRKERLDHWARSLGFQMKQEPSVFIIGMGGGLDVAAALQYNAASVEAVEVNPIIYDLLDDKYRTFTGDLLNNDKVSAHLGEGRSFLRRMDKQSQKG